TTFLKSAGTGTTSLTVDGGNLFTFGVTTTIGAGVALASNKSILMRSDNGIIINNGAVNYTGVNATPTVATITLKAPTGNLTLGGTGTFSNNTTSTTLFRTMTANKSVTIADGTALSIIGGGPVSIRTPRLIFAATGTSPSITATGASAINVDSGSSA